MLQDLDLVGRVNHFESNYLARADEVTQLDLGEEGRARLFSMLFDKGYHRLNEESDLYVRPQEGGSIDVFIDYDLLDLKEGGFTFVRLDHVGEIDSFREKYENRIEKTGGGGTYGALGVCTGALVGMLGTLIVQDVVRYHTPNSPNNPSIVAWGLAGGAVVGLVGGTVLYLLNKRKEEKEGRQFLDMYKAKMALNKRAILVALDREALEREPVPQRL